MGSGFDNGGRSACASGQCARAAYKILGEISKYVDRNFRSTVTVAYIYRYIDIQHNYGENVALKSQVWGSLTLAQLKLNSPPSYVAAERGTSDKTEATRFSQCAPDQRRRLEAVDCDSIRCAQLISGGRRRIHPPYCLAHARPTMCCIRLVINT